MSSAELTSKDEYEPTFEDEKALLTINAEDEQVRIVKELEAKNIFNRLPREIRDIIWKLLLLRPATIKPGYVHYRWHESKWAFGRRIVVARPYGGYGQPVTLNEYEPNYPYGGPIEDSQNMDVIVSTKPSSSQKEYIARGDALPFTCNKLREFGSFQVGCEAVSRGEHGHKYAQIINRMNFVTVEGLHGLAILRVNKAVSEECRQILYGENAFAFDCGHHRLSELVHHPNRIPGMWKKNGAQSRRHLDIAIERMFTHRAFLPRFVALDPMLLFFHRIGRVNAGLITKIKIDGCMKTVSKAKPEEEWGNGNQRLGLSYVYTILATVLREVTPKLRELTLHMDDKIRDPNYKESMLWDDDPFNSTGISDEDRIDSHVGYVATTLNTVNVLNLGSSRSFVKSDRDTKNGSMPAHEDEWGTSARWINFVGDRGS